MGEKPAVLKTGAEPLTGLQVHWRFVEDTIDLLTGSRVSWRFVNEGGDHQTGLRVSGGL